LGQPQNRFLTFFFSVVVLKTAKCPQSQIGATNALVLPAAGVKVPRDFAPQLVQLEDDVMSCVDIEGYVMNVIHFPI